MCYRMDIEEMRKRFENEELDVKIIQKQEIKMEKIAMNEEFKMIPPNEKGIQAVKEAGELIFTAIAAYQASVKQDGKVDFKDIPTFIPVLIKAFEAIPDFKELPAEIADVWSDEEIDILIKDMGVQIEGIGNSLLAKKIVDLIIAIKGVYDAVRYN